MNARVRDDGLRAGQTDEPFLVQALIAKPPVEAFDKDVLHRLSGLDEVEFDAGPARLFEHRIPCRLEADIHNQGLEQAAVLGQFVE